MALTFQSLEHIYLLGTCMSYTGSKIAQKPDAIIWPSFLCFRMKARLWPPFSRAGCVSNDQALDTVHVLPYVDWTTIEIFSAQNWSSKFKENVECTPVFYLICNKPYLNITSWSSSLWHSEYFELRCKVAFAAKYIVYTNDQCDQMIRYNNFVIKMKWYINYMSREML